MKGFFSWLISAIKQLLVSEKNQIPRKTLVLLPLPRENAIWWHMGGVGGEPAMQICADLRVTNISRHNIMLTAFKLKKPNSIGHAHPFNQTDIIKEGSEFLIPAGASVEVRCHCWVQPPVKNKEQEFKADIAVVDQFGNEHWMKKVKFKYS
jgi:hypothetical protein